MVAYIGPSGVQAQSLKLWRISQDIWDREFEDRGSREKLSSISKFVNSSSLRIDRMLASPSRVIDSHLLALLLVKPKRKNTNIRLERS